MHEYELCSRLRTKPLEPKLPLPESFERELMKTTIKQLQPLINKYLDAHPLLLPEEVAPVVASPRSDLWRTSNGKNAGGFIEVLSFCTCADVETAAEGNFTACQQESTICGTAREKRGIVRVFSVNSRTLRICTTCRNGKISLEGRA